MREPEGPHVDQGARDVLDDWGLVATGGIVNCAANQKMEVVR